MISNWIWLNILPVPQKSQALEPPFLVLGHPAAPVAPAEPVAPVDPVDPVGTSASNVLGIGPAINDILDIKKNKTKNTKNYGDLEHRKIQTIPNPSKDIALLFKCWISNIEQVY